jgi:Lipid A 3-O-deacylase (PagL)
MRRLLISVLLATAIFVLMPVTSAEADGFRDGRWRLEFGGAAGLPSNNRESRSGDFLVTGSAEYEFPIHARATFGLRAYPLFIYGESGEDTIFGGGAGIAARVYQNEGSLDGFFGEAGASTIWHSDTWEGNGSRVNFLLELGVGYKFPESDWHVALKFNHLSNSNLSNRNSGVNSLGFAFGYTF